MNITIGDTPFLRDIVQSRRGDFLWSLPFIDVAEDGTETETDLTGCTFEFTILELDAATEKTSLAIGDGITVTGNVATITIPLEDFSTWTRGCAYPYYLTYTNTDDFTKCLFEGAFKLT